MMTSNARDPLAALRDVADLKARSRRLRDQGKLDPAADAMRQAIKILEEEMQERGASVRPEEAAPQDIRNLAVQLADCYGSLAGILRRAGDLDQALTFYNKGREFERNASYRINNTYNQLQWLILQVLKKPTLIVERDPSMTEALRAMLQILRGQTTTDRQSDPWAYSDIGLLCVLLEDSDGANAAWDRMDRANPIPSVYRSGLPVLEDLAKLLPKNAVLRDAVVRFQAKSQVR
jgi:tetratricopeptide (TPR) repeat protein